MKKTFILALLLIGCKDDEPKCYTCDIEINNNFTVQENFCGPSTALGMQRKIKKGGIYGNTVINGQTWTVTDAKCKKRK